MVRALAVPLWRAVPTRFPVGAGAAGLLIAAASRLSGPADSPWACLELLRCAALAGGTGLAFLLDDPARNTTATVPVRPVVRLLLRTVPVVPVAALWWTLALLLVPAGVRPPVGAVTLEAGAVAVLALGLGALAVRTTDRPEPGSGVAVALLFLALVALLLPYRWELLPPGPAARDWTAAHGRWAAVLAAGAVTWTLSLPEPLRRRVRPRGTPGG
ncbi:ABC transporter [Streptomyces sp. NPDC090306]|uniref:ABC transporter n=1 Tax=Streptomyces sp. NPDC090306 TaxID=3365961 RepID=UPI0038071225